MLTPPGFFTDLGRHGLWFAIKKRLGKIDVSGRPLKYEGVIRLSPTACTKLLSDSITSEDKHAVCWAFEGLWMHHPGLPIDHIWPKVMKTITERDEPKAVFALEQIIPYAESLESIKSLELTPYENYLIGIACMRAAKRLRGMHKSQFLSYRSNTLHFLKEARSGMGESALIPAAAGLTVAALAATAAASYDEMRSLKYKGTQAITSSSASTDGG